MTNVKPDWVVRLEAEAKDGFSVADADSKFNSCVIDRAISGWDAAAEDGWRIRNNDLPLGRMAGNPEWQGKYYVDNWLFKGIKFKVSMLTGSKVEIDVKPVNEYNYRHPDEEEADPVDLLDSEVNSAWGVIDATNASESKLYDWYYNGLGVSRGIWNPLKRTSNWLTGQPKVEYVDSRCIFFDPAGRKPDLSDLRYFFHEERWDMKDLRRRYPQWYNEIVSSLDPDRLQAQDTVRIITMQYRETVQMDKVFFMDKSTGLKWSMTLSEFEDDLREQMDNPDNQELYREYLRQYDALVSQGPLPANAPAMQDYDTFIRTGTYLPEKVTMLGVLTSEEEVCWQAIFTGDTKVLLEAPQYLGDKFTYFFLVGNQHSNTVYPFGLVFYMKDLQEIDIAATTIYTMMLFKYHLTKWEIQSGALLNEKDMMEKGHRVDVHPKIDSDWQRSHPGIRAIVPMAIPDPPRAFLELHERISAAQKTMTGAVDVSMGQSQFSGQSGVAVAQLQAASQTYQKEDVDKFRDDLIRTAEWLKGEIVKHRNYPHDVLALNGHNEEQMYPVATNARNQMDDDSTYIELVLQANQEVTKQIEQQLTMEAFKSGLVGKLDTLKKLPFNNPDRLNDNKLKEDGLIMVSELIKQSGMTEQEVAQLIQQAAAAQQQEQLQKSV
jgi:hypothetical protein